jgi:GT2 family glycosyltransferase
VIVLAARAKKSAGHSRKKASGVTEGTLTSDALQSFSSRAENVLTVSALEEVKFLRLDGRELPPGGYADQGSIAEVIQSSDEATSKLIPADVFDEAGYLRLNPDVRRAIELGQIESGYSHYVNHGLAEGRPLPDIPMEARNVMLVSSTEAIGITIAQQVRGSIDALIMDPSGGLMIVGWTDDVTNPISCIRIVAQNWRVVLDTSRLCRMRRADAERALGSRAQHLYGFFGFLNFDRRCHTDAPLKVELWLKGGHFAEFQCSATIVGDVELRDVALGHLAGASFFGNAAIESMGCFGEGLGAELIRFNKTITRRIVTAPYVERFGPKRGAHRGTIVVCLYGKSEFYFVQNCLFAGLPGIDDYEFVYVSNSPEIAETLLREAHSASLIYGLTNSVMILPGNAGFGGANNVAARIARSDRLLIVNPDVFPRDRAWAKKHSELLDSARPEETRLFGVPLYYDDGSLMHGGMYFDIDVGLAMGGPSPAARQICRVEHYGKGAPAESSQFTRARPVPAVTGAFMSIDRPWFEELGGFTEDFIFGHYEDADFCLKSIQKGVAPWLQDIRMWHLEGKGSTRQLPHEGGSMVNRWLFSRTWLSSIEAALAGPAPTHSLFALSSPLPIAASGANTPKQSVERRGRGFR